MSNCDRFFIPRLMNLISLLNEAPDELLYGKSGYLYALLFVNKHIPGKEIIPANHIEKVCPQNKFICSQSIHFLISLWIRQLLYIVSTRTYIFIFVIYHIPAKQPCIPGRRLGQLLHYTIRILLPHTQPTNIDKKKR